MFGVFVLALALIQFATPNLVGNDGYYHIKMSYLLRTGSLKPDFSWLPLTVLNSQEYYDHHYLYHILMIPLTYGDLRLGAKIASIIFPALAFVSIWWLLRGQKVPYARLGAHLLDPESGERFKLKKAKIRGVASEGMICSERELGISERHEGIMVLPPDAPLGLALDDYIGDAILDLDVTPNRPDCLSIIGIAREIAALTGQTVHLPEVSYDEVGEPIEGKASVEIIDPDLCPRYCASLITNVKIGPSPPWLEQRLLACGMRPINNVVDVTNYVLLEYGQPLHAFDYRKLAQSKIIVRRARQGESITTIGDLLQSEIDKKK